MENAQYKKLKAFCAVLAVLLVVNLAATGVLLFGNTKSNSNEQVKYVLYIGTNDKDTYQMEIPFDECLSRVTEICTKHAGGCTLSEATGFWTDDTGTITSERTIQCILEDITLEDVHAIADEIIVSLNQSSVLIETQTVTSEFYS